MQCIVYKLDYSPSSSSFVACFVVHLSCKQMLGALDTDVAISLVDVDSVLEALVDFLGQANLFLWHQLVG